MKYRDKPKLASVVWLEEAARYDRLNRLVDAHVHYSIALRGSHFGNGVRHGISGHTAALVRDSLHHIEAKMTADQIAKANAQVLQLEANWQFNL